MNEAGRKALDPTGLLGQVWSDRYRLDSVLGAGGMAIVYAATDRDGTRVAIKVLRPEVAADAAVRRLFAREGKLANRVGHSGVPKVVDDGITRDGLPFLVQGLIEGETVLARARRVGGRLRAAQVLAIADQALEVLAIAHKAGVVHRDVKPSNLMVGPTGQVYVLDFGLARHSANAAATSSAVIGTPAFMAPEQGIPGGRVDARADFYSLGATVLHLLTGGPVRAGELPPDLPLSSALKPWILRAIAIEPTSRWTNATEMRAQLRRVFQSVIGEPLEDPRSVILGTWADSRLGSVETRDAAAAKSKASSSRMTPKQAPVAVPRGALPNWV